MSSGANRHVTTPSIAAPSSDLIADTRLLEQPSNAARRGPTTGAGTAPLHQALTRVCAARDYACLRLTAFPASDDRSFQAAGIPSISMAVLPALEAHQVWLLLNGGKESGLTAGFVPAILRTIHTPADTADTLRKSLYTSCRYNEQRRTGVRPETRKRRAAGGRLAMPDVRTTRPAACRRVPLWQRAQTPRSAWL